MATATKRPATATKQSLTGYFVQLFTANPALLNERTNDAIMQRWAIDHPGQIATSAITNVLHNAKSQARKQLGTTTKAGKNRPGGGNGAGNGFRMTGLATTGGNPAGAIGALTTAGLSAMVVNIEAATVIGKGTLPSLVAPELRELESIQQRLAAKAAKAGTV